jgi:hypothetical protein
MSSPKPPKLVAPGETPLEALAAEKLEKGKKVAEQVAAEAVDAVKATASEFGEAWIAPWKKLLGKDAEAEPGAPLAQVVIGLENAMGPHVATITNDLTVSGGLASMSVHQGLAPYPAYEQHFPAANPVAGWMGKHKLSGMGPKRTLHKGRQITLQGHDLRLIPHAVFAATPPEAGALLAKCTFLASRKCVFGAAKIRVDGTAPIGSCTLLNWPPTPMVFCADPVSLPLGDAPTSHFNSVRFHMSMLDYIMGWIEIGVDMIVDAAAHAITSGGPEPTDWVAEFYESFNPAEGVAKDAVKNAAEAGIQTTVLYAYDASDDPHEPDYRSVEWSFEMKYLDFELYSYSPGTVTKQQKPDPITKEKTMGGPTKKFSPIEVPDRDLSKWGTVL